MSRGAVWLETATSAHRFGVKGPRASEALVQLGLAVPVERNTWAPLRGEERADSPDVISRLGNTEFFVEESGEGLGIRALELLTRDFRGAWPVLREDDAFVLGGPRAPAALAEVCNIDFAAISIAQRPVFMTLMTGVGVLVLPQVAENPAGAGIIFRIWCDPSYGSYLRETLAEVSGVSTTTKWRAE